MALRTEDGRAFDLVVDPEKGGSASGAAPARGAYFAARDELTIRDAFGFFVARRWYEAEREPRLFVLPESKPFPFERRPRAGGVAFREEPSFKRTDELTESRKYVPGDDPRRINWKLYGHSGELFVREGDPEPPPRSRYAVLVDASVDGALYPGSSGSEAVDALASLALGLSADLLAVGLELSFGGVGMPLASGDLRDASRCFARIAALPLDTDHEVRGSDDPGTRTVVLALPRGIGKSGALDRFLSERSAVSAPVEVLFLDSVSAGTAVRRPGHMKRLLFQTLEEIPTPDAELLAGTASECVRFFDGKGGARARRLEA